MSEQAILQRLRTVDRLRELCLSLMKAKKEQNRPTELNSAKKPAGHSRK